MPKSVRRCTKDPFKMNATNRERHLRTCEECRLRLSGKQGILQFMKPKQPRVAYPVEQPSVTQEINELSVVVDNVGDGIVEDVVENIISQVIQNVILPEEQVIYDANADVSVISAADDSVSSDGIGVDNSAINDVNDSVISEVDGSVNNDTVADLVLHEDVHETEDVTLIKSVIKVKCEGFRFLIQHPDEIYSTFPFTVLPEKEFVFENGCLHHKECSCQEYNIYNPHIENNKVNKHCFDLQFSPGLQKLISNMNDQHLHKKQIKNRFLSHRQLEQRLNHHKETEAKYRLQIHTQSKTIARLNKTLDLHQRFLHSLQEHKVHRLHDVVDVALRQRRSIGFILQKVTDAIDGIYNPHYKEDDKELAFVILQFGGPALLDIVHRAIRLPHSSTAYKLVQGKRTISTSVNAKISDLAQNMQLTGPKYGGMLKIDEHYVDKRGRWCPTDNNFYGVCFDHARNTSLALETWDDVMRLKQAVDDGTIHLTKECMVIALGFNAQAVNAHPIVVWPTCSKDEVEIQMKVIQGLSDEYFVLNSGSPLMCWSTDGDSTRRQIFDKLMDHQLSRNSPIYGIITKLRFIDTMVGKHDETLDFDAKHLAKRMRNYFIGSNCKFGDTLLYRKDILQILELSPEKPKSSLKELINVKDKQNVPLATEFLLTLSKGLRSPSLKNINIRVASVADDLVHYADVIDGLLSIYSFVE